jgi:hypothetical protein
MKNNPLTDKFLMQYGELFEFITSDHRIFLRQEALKHYTNILTEFIIKEITRDNG